MENHDLCLCLADSENEQEVIKLLKKCNYWDDPSCWRYFGDTPDNYSTIGNQQERAEYALVEKIINSVDALLMGKCLENNINPKSAEAPKNINEALIRFFDVPDGKLSKLSSSKRGILAENICLVATGLKANPCYSIIDNGEGQSPDSMPSTLLGLFKSIKTEIAFVQGKFHMGGTGAFRFCGEHRMELVISKRNPKILKPGENGEWGFSIIRREEPTGTRRSSVYTYLAPGKKILSFNLPSLPLKPSSYPNKFGESLRYGTFIKLYEYNLAGLKTNIQFDLYNVLSLLVPNIALPVRLYERREGYSGHSYETTLAGLSVRLEEDKRDNLEPEYPTSHTISCMGQKMQAQVFAFKREQAANYRRNEGILFTVNGQTHGHLASSFFLRDNVGMGYLKDSLLVIVDCSDLDNLSKEDLFMNSRDRLCNCELRSHIERELEQILKGHPGLRSLKESRRQIEIKTKLAESKPLVDVIEKVIKNSPTLARLLSFGGKLPNPFKFEETGTGNEYISKKYPTFFRLKKKTNKDTIKNCPINWRFRVQFETDAPNDYFSRDDDAGKFSLCVNGVEVTDYNLSLWNGTANLTVSLPKKAKPNYILQYNTSVKDVTKWEAFEDIIKVKIDEAREHNKGGDGKEKPLPPGDTDTGKQKPSNLDIPLVTDVHKQDWEKHGFDDYDALRVVPTGDGLYDFFVNIDNICLLTELKYAKPSSDIELLTAQFRYGIVLIGLSLIRAPNTNTDETENSIPDNVKLVTRLVDPILLPMILTLSHLESEDIRIDDTVTF